MFAMMGIVSTGINREIVPKVAENAYIMADAMLLARKPPEETGIAAIKKRVKK
jgi:hypothetical protein